jgi:hypothetical protein
MRMAHPCPSRNSTASVFSSVVHHTPNPPRFPASISIDHVRARPVPCHLYINPSVPGPCSP